MFECDQGAPRVTDYDGLLDTELRKGFVQKFGLGIGCPQPIARTLGVTKARPVECNDAITLGLLGKSGKNPRVEPHSVVTLGVILGLVLTFALATVSGFLLGETNRHPDQGFQ